MNQKMVRCTSSFITAENEFVKEGTILPADHKLVRPRSALFVEVSTQDPQR